MFDKLDKLSEQTYQLAHALVRETPAGQPFNPASPTYQKLQATLLETQEHVKQLEAEAIQRFDAEMAAMPPVASVPQPEAAPTIMPPASEEAPEGTVTFHFEKAHASEAATIREQIAQLAAMAHAQQRPT